MKELLLLLRTHKKRLIFAALALLLSLQLAQVAGIIQNVSTHLSIVGSFDDDARLILRKTLLTRWYKDNGGAAYGPVYYRVAHTLASLFPGRSLASTETSEQARERGTHFILMFMSLASVIGLALLIAALIAKDWNARLLLTLCLSSAFFADPTFARFTTRAHPDTFFALLVTVASLLTLYALSRPKDEPLFKAAAGAWGLATGTKLSVVFHLPALLLMWIPPIDKKNWQTAGRFALWAFIGYFLFNFPQSIVLDRPVKFLLSQSQYSVSPDASSLLEWIQLFIGQSWRPALLVLIGWLCAGQTERDSALKLPLNSRLYILCFLPFALMLTRKVTSSHDHYTFPFVGTALLALVLTLNHVRLKKISNAWAPYAWLSLPLLCLFTWGFVPDAVSDARTVPCQADAIQFENDMRIIVKSDDRVHLDPYIPMNPEEYPEGQMDAEWQITWDTVRAKKQNLLVLQSRYYGRYLDHSETNTAYLQKENSEWKESVAFYESFVDKKQIVDPNGNKWEQIKSVPACNWEVWRRQ